MKRLLLFLTYAVLIAAAALFSPWLEHPITTYAQTNTFCASNLTCTVTAAWTFSSNLTVTGSPVIGGPSPWIDVTAPAYGAKCDGVTDDTTAINAALTAANTAGGGTVFIPSGKTCVAASQIVMDQMQGVTLAGGISLVAWWNGNPGKPLLKLTGTTSPLIAARSSISVHIIGVNIQYTNAAFNGEVIGTEHIGSGCGGGGCDTNQFVIQDSSISGVAGSAISAICGLCWDKTIDSWSTRNTFEYMVNGIRELAAGGSYSINNHIEGNQFSTSTGTISGTMILSPGQNCKIGPINDFEFGTAAGTPTGIDFSLGNCGGGDVDTNFFSDAPAGFAGTYLKNIGPGGGVQLHGNVFTGGSGLSTTLVTFNNGASGIEFTGNFITQFGTAFNFGPNALRDINIHGNVYSSVTNFSTGVSTILGGVIVDNSFHNALSDLYLIPNTNSSTRVALISNTLPTIAAAGCGGAAASIVTANGTAAFKVNVGTTPTSACTLTFPTATTGWNVFCTDITTNSTSVFLQKQTGAESQTSVTITNFNDVAVATAFVASDILKCTAAAD